MLLSPIATGQTVVIRPIAEAREFHGIKLSGTDSENRPKIGLVLSGGGARGLAQIGVLKALERHNIPIDLIVGNSLGSVVGGLYAAGYSTTQLESIAVSTNWNELLSFSEETRRTDLFVGQKRSQQEGHLVIRFDGLEPIIPSAISGGQRLSNFFSYLTLQAVYHPNPSFDDLKIPFRATATDLISGKRIILERGSLAEAMRASITVPLLYAPLEMDTMVVVDGGLTSNIPADVAKSMKCDIIIVVNSTSSMRKSHQLEAPWEIADQIMSIMMQEPNRLQLQLADVVITPQTGDRIVSDFIGVDSLILAGELAAESSISLIDSLIAARRKSSDAGLARHDFDSVSVRFSGDGISSSMQEEILILPVHERLSERTIQSFLDRLSAQGNYSDVYAELTPSEIVYHAVRNPVLDEVRIVGNSYIPDSGFREILKSHEGEEFTYANIQQAMEDVIREYRRAGYSLARIESVKVEPKRGSVSFRINEGTVSQIRYEGNDRTREYVIRREVDFDAGDVFTIEKASRSLTNIKSTGLFDYVLLDVRWEGRDPVIVFKVKEKYSELLRLGLHADNEHNMVGTISARDANFRGAWEDLGLTARYGYRDRLFMADYTINRIFNSYLTFNVRGYFKSRDVFTYRDASGLPETRWDRLEDIRYRESKSGGSLIFGSYLERFGDVTAELRAEHHSIRAITEGAFPKDDYTFVSLKLQSIIDTEDKFVFPTEGIFLAASYEAASKSIGSSVSYGKLSLQYESYHTMLHRHTFHPRITFGFADQTLPRAEQFSLGGFNSFFGLREDDSRGRQLFLVNTEYRFWLPFTLIFDTYVKARYDLGTIALVPEELKLKNFRHGIGMEIALETPLGQASVGAGRSFYFRREIPKRPLSWGPVLFYFSFGPNL